MYQPFMTWCNFPLFKCLNNDYFLSYLLSVGYTCAIFKKCPQDVAIVLKSVSSSCCPMKLRQVTLPPPAQYECVLLLLYSPHDLQTFILIRAKLHSLKEISPSSPSPSIFKTHTIMPTEIKKKKTHPAPPLYARPPASLGQRQAAQQGPASAKCPLYYCKHDPSTIQRSELNPLI